MTHPAHVSLAWDCQAINCVVEDQTVAALYSMHTASVLVAFSMFSFWAGQGSAEGRMW
jgi:hypothetical protein